MNPLEAIDFGGRAMSLFGPVLGNFVEKADLSALSGLNLDTDEPFGVASRLQPLLGAVCSSIGDVKSTAVTGIMTEAIRRCYTPHNESLADDAVFNHWFKQHPKDLYMLGVMAVYHLVKDFFPSLPGTVTSRFRERATMNGAA